MRKFSFKNIIKFIPAVFALISGLLLFSTKTKTLAEVSTLPEYFSVYTANYDSLADEYEKASQTGTFTNGDAIFLKNNEAVVLEFVKDKLLMSDGKTYRVSQEISYTITINGKMLSTSLIKEEGFDFVDKDNQIFKLALNPSIASVDGFRYGSYTISFSYWYLDDNYDTKTMSFSCSFYVFGYNQFCGNTNKNFSANKVSGAYFYNYQGDTKDGNLFNLTYDYSFFNVKITKVYQQLTFATEIKLVNDMLTVTNTNELSSPTNLQYVKVDKLENNKARITFNDLGTYYISYETRNPFGSGEIFKDYFNINPAEYPNNADTVYIFGYQAFYTGPDGLVEFKQASEDNSSMVKQQADVTTLVNDVLGDDVETRNKLQELIENSSLNIVKTNQAPINFATNATIQTDECKYYYFENLTSFKEGLPNATSSVNPVKYYQDNYTCSPLSSAGIYLVRLAYTYDKFSGTMQYQYFLFEVTTASPNLTITEDGNEHNYDVPNDYYTYSDVLVKKAESGVFDSPSVLKVYKSTAFNKNDLNNSANATIVNNSITLTESAMYKVEITYGSRGQKNYVSYFTIDKTGITDVNLSTLINYTGSLYTKNENLNGFFTNSSIAISWNNKESYGKAKTYAEYKFFPTAYSSSFASTLDSDTLKNFYRSPYTTYGVPSTHTFNYYSGDVPVSNYANTAGLTTLSESSILSASGLYIIKIYDQTALTHEQEGVNVVYKCVFVDKTKTNIIASSNDVWTFANDAKVTSNDYSLFFGSHKLIQFEKMSTDNNDWDKWLKKLVTSDEYKKYFSSYKDKIYLKINNLNKVYYTKNNTEVYSYILSLTNNYSKTEQAVSGITVNESQYVFYLASSSNTSIQDSFESYKKNFDACHMVTFSTDNSKMRLSYINSDGYVWDLQQFSVLTSESGVAKYNYYQPTAKNTLNNNYNKEILNFSYCTEPSSILSVSSIKMEYYAFEKSDHNTYVFKNTPTSTLYIYQKDSTPLGSSTGEAYTYSWEINVENYNITASQTGTRTKAGKYVITRTYETAPDANDPKERILHFIVDRNGIINAPEIDDNGNSIYYTGGAIKLQVLNNYQSIEDSTLFFHDIYFANQMSSTNSSTANPILITNLLPVTLYVPAYKYGYEVFNTNTYNFKYTQKDFKKEDSENYDEFSATMYYDIKDKQYKPYDSYKLSAYVEYRETNVLTTNYTERFDFTKVLANNFLTDSKSDGILTFNKQGYYHVVISSNGGDTFAFDFQIKYEEPAYSLLDDKNNVLTSENGICYTNKSNIRIAWQNSSSEFLANINHEEITYKISNGISGKIDPSKIVSNGDGSYYVDLNLKEINGAFVHGNTIDITLQFNGKKEDYNNQAYFSKTTTVMIDLEAPISNIASLIAQTGLSFTNLREYKDGFGNRYNMSKSSGLFANYSYILDVQNMLELLKTPAQTQYDFYKAYYRVFDKDGVNTKYVIGNIQESEIYLENYNDTTSNILFNASQQSTPRYTYELLKNEYVGKYVEIIEEDYAGNRTVFTIYISDVTQSSETAISYLSLNSSTGAIPNDISFSNLSSSMDIRSKYSLNLESINLLSNNDYLNGKYYQLISINGEKYVRTPFSNNKFYKISEFVSLEESPVYSLESISYLSSSSSTQPIILYSVPYFGQITLQAYVLNKKLDYYTLAQYEGTQLVEGIMIKIPTTSADTNLIYATNLKVTGKIGGLIISPLVIDDQNYFTLVQPEYKSQSYKISYIESPSGEKFFRFEITRALNKNDYFIYEITDNFGEVIKVPHIYGQIEITNPITSDSDIITSYNEDGTYVYYASENIIYKYDTTIYSGETFITVSHDGINKNFRITKNGSNIKIEIFDNNTSNYKEDTTYSAYFDCKIISGVVMVLELKQASISVSEGKLGNSYYYTVTLNLNKDFSTTSKTETDEKHFCIYNKVPKISLLGQSGDDVTSILGNKGVYTNNITVNYEQTILNFAYEVYLITPDNIPLLLTNEYLAKDNGTYRIVINYMGDLKGLSKTLAFTINNTSDFKFAVMKIKDDGSYEEVQSTGKEFNYTVSTGNQTVNKTEQIHYIVNCDYTILLNESLNLTYKDPEPIIVDAYTTIYIIHTEYSTATSTEYFSCRIAITKIPLVYSLFKENEFVEYDSSGNSQDLTKTTSTISSILTKDGYEAGRKIAWKDWYLIPENKIIATIYYGEVGKTIFTPVITKTDELNTITLKTSGVYYFKFTDLAGNNHFFGTYQDSEFFAIKYLSSVIFEVNDQSPINYAIYDDKVKISVPETTLSYYDSNARPTLNVQLNGVDLEVKHNSRYEWTFDKAGLYKVWFSAKISGENIYEAPLYFTILSSRETRTVFSFTAYNNYFIEDILLNGVSVNEKLANPNTGTMYLNKYLKDITLHKNDLKTGEGVWTFVINTNNEFNQKYTFSVWINNPTVPITVSHESGTTTNDDILITFLSSNILSEAGDCILKISGLDDLYITQEALENGTLTELNEITLTSSREYFIEVTTLSGQLLFSSYINKTEPLNAISIILIVVVSIVVVAGTVIFFLLRRRMKIK